MTEAKDIFDTGMYGHDAESIKIHRHREDMRARINKARDPEEIKKRREAAVRHAREHCSHGVRSP